MRTKDSVSILVVDDEREMRDLMAKLLTRDGYQVHVAPGGAEALQILKETEIAIVVSDSQMPEMTGFELLQTIKKEYPSISVVMMTAYGDTYSIKDALLLGADEYITKPFKSFEISLVVERAYWRKLAESGQASPLTT